MISLFSQSFDRILGTAGDLYIRDSTVSNFSKVGYIEKPKLSIIPKNSRVDSQGRANTIALTFNLTFNLKQTELSHEMQAISSASRTEIDLAIIKSRVINKPYIEKDILLSEGIFYLGATLNLRNSKFSYSLDRNFISVSCRAKVLNHLAPSMIMGNSIYIPLRKIPKGLSDIFNLVVYKSMVFDSFTDDIDFIGDVANYNFLTQ